MRSDYQNAIGNNFDVNNTQGVEINAIEAKRLDSNYTCKDQNWDTGKYQGDIYISTPNETHNAIVNHHENPDYKLPEHGYPGTSGYFTNEATASNHFEDNGKFNSVGLGHDLQQAPHYNENTALKTQADDKQYYPEYNGHLDCFRVNEDKMQEHFGTTDFYAATAQCKENTAWGEGGGFQGYNPYINEMINKGALEYVPENSRTCANNECLDYAERKNQASEEAKAVNDYIENSNIQGKQDERLGYNELSQNINKAENDSCSRVFSNHTNTDKVADGGGTHAPPSHGDKSDLSDKNTSDETGKIIPQAEQFTSGKPEDLPRRGNNSKEAFSPVTRADMADKEPRPKESFSSFTETDLAKRNEIKANQGTDPTVQTPAVSGGLKGSDHTKSSGTVMGV